MGGLQMGGVWGWEGHGEPLSREVWHLIQQAHTANQRSKSAGGAFEVLTAGCLFAEEVYPLVLIARSRRRLSRRMAKASQMERSLKHLVEIRAQRTATSDLRLRRRRRLQANRAVSWLRRGLNLLSLLMKDFGDELVPCVDEELASVRWVMTYKHSVPISL